MKQLRPYQQDAVNSVQPYIEGRSNGNPVIVIPTGGGKTWVMAHIVENFVEHHFPKKVLVLSHVAEILEQNYATIKEHMGFSIGYYSAKMGERSTECVIIVGGIQSIVNLDEDDPFWGEVGLVIVDECHRVNHKNKGSYRKVLDRVDACCIGLTATPFRLGQGYLTRGKEPLFNRIVHNSGTKEKYNELVDQGYLTRIISKSTSTNIDVSNVKITGGDYNTKELSDAVDKTDITEAAVVETIRYGKRYKHWLVFAIDIEHAEHIREIFEKHGVPACTVHSKMDDSRSDVIQRFKNGEFRALINVEVLTTGFDFPEIDLIVMLRPTQSPIIHVQTVGRGARVAPGKDHCLFLDFAGNTERLGPINDVYVRAKGERRKKGIAAIRTKTCPKCGCYAPIRAQSCEVCKHDFVVKTNRHLRSKPSDASIVASNDEKTLDSHFKEGSRWLNVQDVNYSRYVKRNGSKVLRVQYNCGLMVISEWIHFGAKTRAGMIAQNWIKWRKAEHHSMPATWDELMSSVGSFKRPKMILVNLTGKYKNVIDYKF